MYRTKQFIVPTILTRSKKNERQLRVNFDFACMSQLQGPILRTYWSIWYAALKIYVLHFLFVILHTKGRKYFFFCIQWQNSHSTLCMFNGICICIHSLFSAFIPNKSRGNIHSFRFYSRQHYWISHCSLCMFIRNWNCLLKSRFFFCNQSSSKSWA